MLSLVATRMHLNAGGIVLVQDGISPSHSVTVPANGYGLLLGVNSDGSAIAPDSLRHLVHTVHNDFRAFFFLECIT